MIGFIQIKRFVFKNRVKLSVLGILFVAWLFCLPKVLFTTPTSTVVTSSDNALLGARIADDGQWRFPKMDSVPERFRQSVLLFEDEYFYKHPGFNPISIFNAIKHNLTQETRRGGSTITQQVIRLSRQNKSRTYIEKVIEIFMATRLEFRHSKEEILKLYSTHTPYGGNVVGLETASWRYFGIPAHELSWGQSATLAVLPNAPSLIFPGRNEGLLLKKRNRLLDKLLSKGIIDQTTHELAIAEPLPQKPLQLPNLTPHLTERIKKEHPGKRIKTSVDSKLQQRANSIAKIHHQHLKSNEIHNLSILVLEVDTRNVLAYVGNAPTDKSHSNYVDIITKKRSTGSTLKPFLFASLLHEGQLLPDALVKDVPTVINGYNPKNFNKKYSGAVPASRALSRSLNIPAVRLLRSYGLQKFYNKLKKTNLKSMDKPSSHYGLALILGGVESSLWDITKTYASSAAVLNNYVANSSTYRSNEFVEPNYLFDYQQHFGSAQYEAPIFNAGAIYHMTKALQEVNRPEGGENWQFFNESQPIAWKTGTSFGFKDAWAVGVTPKYAIGIWAGNADGEGRPGLTGITAAAPILFDVLDALPHSGNFEEPFDDLAQLETCKKTGFRASSFCVETETELQPINGSKTQQCPYHKQIILDDSQKFRVNTACYPLENMVYKNWFSLPTGMEYYYSITNPNYKSLPRYLAGCDELENQLMEFIYPKPNETILLPKDLGNSTTEVIFKLAHQRPEINIHWYLDDTYIGSTTNFHELIYEAKPSDYILTAVDDDGNRIQQGITLQMASEN
ncbi:penicillin-binding protein 1C [Croceitalea sp. MTPC9]|uniref:penicillin-binding protein 1C n=1 Tax=unclassified Croceitalea TaxID=2632280 RepID=UPI002B3DF71C|nr:penicillin-binding protein 1C [Croceitalea sp. MTPC6]GMN17172.1 penicillin-binding protein 1C [Croceitalea sp. MTPC9]